MLDTGFVKNRVQRGFLSITSGLAITIAVLAGLLYLQTERLRLAKAQHATFVSQIDAIGKAQAAIVKAKIAQDKATKEALDVKNQEVKRITADNVRLMRESRNSGGGKLPAIPTGTSRPDLACFDRAEYQRAYGEFIAEIRGFADEGAACTIDLNTSKEWVRGQAGR